MAKIRLCKTLRPIRRNPKRSVWAARWVGSDGKEYFETLGDVATMDKLRAKELVREMQGKMDNDLAPVDKPKRMTLKAFLELDREAAVNQRPRTVDEMRRSAAHAIAALGADADVTTLDAAAAGRLVKHLRGKDLAEATVAKVVAHLKAAFGRALAERRLVRNPFKGCKLPKLQRGGVLYHTAVAVQALIEAAPDEWWRVLIRLAASTGLRQGELLNLMWRDIDFDLKVVTVAPKRGGTFTAGDKEYPILPWTAKDHETRSVPLVAEAVEALRVLRRVQEGPRRDVETAAYVLRAEPRSEYVFLSLAELERLDRYRDGHDGRLPDKLVNNFTRSWAVIVRRSEAAMAKGVKDPQPWACRDFHGLRRSFATRLAGEGAPPKVLQRLLGHSATDTTMNYYVADVDAARWVRTALGRAS